MHWLREAFKHHKTIGAIGDGAQVLTVALGDANAGADGVLAVDAADAAPLIAAIAMHRHWGRAVDAMPA